MEAQNWDPNFYRIDPWAQSYQRQIPENCRFLELKILLFIEVKIMGRKLSFSLIQITSKYQNAVCLNPFVCHIEETIEN